ncbi:MAG TPA: MbtH family NRPS accessory protein [Solirubrobacterales bacterium]|nr:MbtH family NRPS accessory protein [Solirubrobacterales bacterium]
MAEEPEVGASDVVYDVVVNDEEQYSIWPVDRPLPSGWTAVGSRGSREECLDHIAEVWTDMRPRSLREAYEA